MSSTILSVLDSCKATAGYSRPMREGEEVLNSGLVIGVGLKQKDGDVFHIQALVLRTSGLSSKHPALVELWVDSSKEYGERLMKEESRECDCPAGRSEKCKHIVSVMLYLARLVFAVFVYFFNVYCVCALSINFLVILSTGWMRANCQT